jgi:ABC-type amino acid transport substrate-binding protein
MRVDGGGEDFGLNMRRPVRRLGRWAAAVAALTLLAACGEEPTPPSLTGFTPPNPSVGAGETLDLRVEYDANDYALDSFEWTAEAGAIEGNGKAAITYRAPDAAGAYKLTVTASVAGRDLAPLSLDTLVEVRPAPAAAVSQAPAAEPSAGQRAAAAARAALQATTSEATEAGEEVSEAAQTAVERATETVAGADQETRAAEPAAADEAARPDAAGREDEADGVAAILDRSRVLAVVASDLPPFSFEQDGQRVGFEVDLVREFARRWVGNADAVTLLPVTPDERIATLRQGDADLIAAALTKTAGREQLIDFSQTYFKDGQRLLVAEDADIAGPCDLAGKKVAVLAGTTSLDNMAAEAASCGFESEDAVVFERRDRALAALLEGEVDAFTSDGIALERLAAGQPLKVVGNHFSEEPYGIGVRRGDDRLRRLVDLTLQKMAEDGTFAAIYRKWFGDDLSPYPLQADPSLAREQPLAALATSDLPPLFPPEPAKAAGATEYVVQPGDTLSTIAGQHFGDVGPNAWRAIWEANKATIGDDPNRIRAGMRLTLPASL